MNKHLRKSFVACASALAIAAGMISAPMSASAASISLLAGKWTAVLSGNTGCGSSSMFVTFQLNTSGVGTATIQGHSTGCADGTTSGHAFRVLTLLSTGQGTASLECGAGCGWNFRIQVASNNDEFIMTDVDPANPNNTPTGVALRQFP